MRLSTALLLAFLLTVAAAGQDQNASVTGVVIDSVTRRPLRKVVVSLEFPTPAQQQRATTDDAGTFAFHGLKPGQYRVVVERSDYPAWKAATVSALENPEPVEVELVPGAVVSGRILDEDGDPLKGCWVQARRAERPDQIVSPQIARNDDDPSDYRLFGLLPGKYILAAQCVVPAFQPRPFSAGPDPPPALGYPQQFYPGVPDAASAGLVDLAAGTEKAGVDFRMRTAHVTQVRAVVAPGAHWNSRNLFVRLFHVGDEDGMSPESSENAFRFAHVFPGSYVLLATTFDQENRLGAIQRVEVKDQPVNLEIELKHAVDVTGTVELESGANTANVPLQQIHIYLLREKFEATGPFESGADTHVKQDGSFTLQSVMPAHWRLYVDGASVFIKSVWLGTKEVSGRNLDLSSGPLEALRIVLSGNTATIRGTAPPGMIVAHRDLGEKALFRESLPAQVDQSGQFKIEGLAPGRYRVAAGESFDAIPEDGGREVTVQEGETAVVDLHN